MYQAKAIQNILYRSVVNMNRTAVNVKDFERHLKVCNGKNCLVICNNGTYDFQTGIESLDMTTNDNQILLTCINNKWNKVCINKNKIISFEFDKDDGQFIIDMSSIEIIIEVVM